MLDVALSLSMLFSLSPAADAALVAHGRGLDLLAWAPAAARQAVRGRTVAAWLDEKETAKKDPPPPSVDDALKVVSEAIKTAEAAKKEAEKAVAKLKQEKKDLVGKRKSLEGQLAAAQKVVGTLQAHLKKMWGFAVELADVLVNSFSNRDAKRRAITASRPPVDTKSASKKPAGEATDTEVSLPRPQGLMLTEFAFANVPMVRPILPNDGTVSGATTQGTTVAETAVCRDSMLGLKALAGPVVSGAASAHRACPGLTECPTVCPPPCSRLAVFTEPAQFDLVRYGLTGARLCTDGAVIYEGMTIEFKSTGEYEVRFTTTVPDRPVTMHLQLCVSMLPRLPEGAYRNLLFQPLQTGTFTLTLPPIRIEPRIDGAAESLGLIPAGSGPLQSFQVRHTGFSWLIAQNFPYVQGVTRQGAARWERAVPKLFGDPLTSVR